MESKSVGLPCQQCNKLATKVCSDCNDAAFCSRNCIEIAWPYHKEQCDSTVFKRALHRTGRLAKTVFLLIREKFYTIPLEDVTVHGDTMMLINSRVEDAENTILFPVSQQLDFGSLHNKEMVLSNESSAAALSWTWALFQRLLIDSGLAYGLCVQDMCIGDDMQNQVYVFGRRLGSMSYGNEDRYVVDITGCQYGLDDDPVMLHKQHCEELEIQDQNIKHFPFPLEKPGSFPKLPDWSTHSDAGVRALRLGFECSNYVDEVLEDFRYRNMTLLEALQKKDQTWENVSAAFIGEACYVISLYHEYLHSEDGPLMIDNHGWSVMKHAYRPNDGDEAADDSGDDVKTVYGPMDELVAECKKEEKEDKEAVGLGIEF